MGWHLRAVPVKEQLIILRRVHSCACSLGFPPAISANDMLRYGITRREIRYLLQDDLLVERSWGTGYIISSYGYALMYEIDCVGFGTRFRRWLRRLGADV